jgi:hypothetical protein
VQILIDTDILSMFAKAHAVATLVAFLQIKVNLHRRGPRCRYRGFWGKSTFEFPVHQHHVKD